MKTRIIVKAPNCKDTEHLIVDPPYTLYGSPSLPQSQSIIMKVGGLKKMIENLSDDDSFRIEWFGSYRATEFSFIKKSNQ